MSYDLAVWEGDRPVDDDAATDAFDELMEQSEASDERVDPTPAIRRYIETLLARWPDIDEHPDSPWSVSPLMDCAEGPVAYLNMRFDRVEDVVPVAAALATEHGLVCYDPQMGAVLP